jgi:hypothetical protein
MKVQRRFVYTQTRLQSRHGLRPDERTWQQLEAQNELASYLQLARQTNLRPWVLTLHARDPHHLLESTLVRLYRAYIDEVAHWQPQPWQAAVQWVKVLLDLPVLQHLLMGNTSRPWMANEPNIKAFTVSNLEQRLQAMHDSPYAPIVQGWQSDQTVVQAWLEHWQQLWPKSSEAHRNALLLLMREIQEHLDQFHHAEPEQAWPLRNLLTHRLNILFRRYSYQPATAFIHLALVAHDMERLRGGIVQRSVFPPRPESEPGQHKTNTAREAQA